MPFYELVCISRSRITSTQWSDLLRKSALIVLQNGGVVRGFRNLGEQELPYRMKRHQQHHSRGKYWLMHFDANPVTLDKLTDSLRIDTQVIRHTTIKLGSRLKDVIQSPEKSSIM